MKDDWFSTVKSALKCPVCGERTLEPKKYIRSYSYTRGKDRGTMECTNCGHTEVFR